MSEFARIEAFKFNLLFDATRGYNMSQIQHNVQYLIFIMASGLLEIPPPISEKDLSLSAREHEVLSYLVRGKTAKEIGEQLEISRRTVEHHIENIKSKTNCTSKAELLSMYWSGL